MPQSPQNGTGDHPEVILGNGGSVPPASGGEPSKWKIKKKRNRKASYARSLQLPYQLLDPNSQETWLRLRNETGPAFQAFAIYRDMKPEERSLAKVRVVLGKSRTLVERWSTIWNWVERVEAWDRYQDKIIQQELAKANAKAIVDMKKRHIQASIVMQQKVAAGLSNLDVKKMKPHELSRMERDAVMIERISRDVATEISEDKVSGEIDMNVKGKVLHGHIDLNRLNREELRTLLRLTEKASVADGDEEGVDGAALPEVSS